MNLNNPKPNPKQALPDRFFQLEPMLTILQKLAVLGAVRVSNERPPVQSNEQFYRADQSFFRNGVVKTATVQ